MLNGEGRKGNRGTGEDVERIVQDDVFGLTLPTRLPSLFVRPLPVPLPMRLKAAPM